MIKHVLLMLFLVSAPLNAQVVVKSGEHDGFTRLVMNYGRPVPWLLGRGEDGYQLRVVGETIVYDLSRAFAIIGKSRLSSIQIDDNSGSINFSLACPCNATAFEFRPGIVVVDIHDGEPKNGSQFENALPDASKEDTPVSEIFELNQTADLREDSTPSFEWRKATEGVTSSIPIDLNSTDGSEHLKLQASQLKAGLIEELGRGASRGLVELTIKEKPGNDQSDLSDVTTNLDAENVIVTSDTFPGFKSTANIPMVGKLATSGEACIETTRLEMDSWLGTDPVANQLYSASDGIVGEFDGANSDNIVKAAKLLLAIGFGAEARQLLNSFEQVTPDVDLLLAISFIVDGHSDPTMRFKGQETCSTASALWAVLGTPSQEVSGPINADAVFQAFSTLPVEARKNLGPNLAAVLIEHSEFVAAKRIHDAISRAEEGNGANTKLIEASIDLANNEVASAAAIAEDVIADPGPETWKALVTLIEAKAKLALPIDNETLLSIEASSREHSGAQYHAQIQRSLVLAYGLSGDFKTAFKELSKNPAATVDLWKLLSEIGSDDDIINFGILSNQSDFPEIDDESRQKILGRLAGLGMTQAAMSWMKSGDSESSNLIAEAEIFQGNATSALSLLGTGKSDQEIMLSARALQGLGQHEAAAELYSKIGDEAAKDSAIRQARKWDEVGQASEVDWKGITDQLNATQRERLPNVGPLTQANNLILESAKSRSDLTSFLNAVRSGSPLNSAFAGRNLAN